MKSGMKTDNDTDSGLKSGLKTTQEQILLLIKRNPQISFTAIAEELKMARSGIAKRMQQLQASGIIKRIGPDKGGHWEIVSPPN
jgi:ATP-dependent DNA helicase RecG